SKQIAPINMVVGERCEKVVCNTDRVEIAGEMQIDVFHRHDLRIAAACGAALHAEARPETRLSETDDGRLADAVEGVAESDRRGRLALAGRGRRHCRNQDQLGVRPRWNLVQVVERDFGFEMAIEKKIAEIDAELPMAYLRNRQHVSFLRDLDI